MEILWPLNAFVVELLGRYRPDLSRKSADDVSLVVHEAFTNICVHAYEGSESGLVVVRIKLSGLHMELRFEDSGKAFDEARWKAPDLEQPLESGRGIWLMKQLTDAFIYKAGHGERNSLTLVKNLRMDSETESEDGR